MDGKRDEIEARAQEIHPRLQLARIRGWKRDRYKPKEMEKDRLESNGNREGRKRRGES